MGEKGSEKVYENIIQIPSVRTPWNYDMLLKTKKKNYNNNTTIFYAG